VFPELLIAFGPGGDGAFMLSSFAPIAFSPDNIATVLRRPGVLEDLSSAFDSPAQSEEEWVAAIVDAVWLSGDDVRAFGGDGPLITDDRPLPEYFLLRRWLGEPSPKAVPERLRGAEIAAP